MGGLHCHSTLQVRGAEPEKRFEDSSSAILAPNGGIQSSGLDQWMHAWMDGWMDG
eukprot:CAMPEP_0172401862 /NCGR_PEP_ID=MMETSP1061-20121228/52242_1 /TAXON_ID=37318 /ORGANISM="Pseudo-nitzschia pungens, Strain cf. pungens" /LENGTH=54 /DNA_ID=CAMNT_0013135649 /DNA_START=153 /DNA_END=313 /DNA_ORIENTATION=-